MKKIIPFLVFLPLLIFILLIVESQSKNKIGTKIMLPTPTSSSTPISNLNTTSSVGQINLLISSPVSGVTVDSSSISVSGTTGSNINVVVNNQDLISNADGTFKTSVLLDEGENYISIVAYNDSGEVTEREILILRTVEGL